MFKQKDLCLLAIGLYTFGGVIAFTTYFLYFTKELGLSNTQALLLDVPMYMTQFLLELPSGAFADKFGYKKSFVISIGLTVFANFIYAIAFNYSVMFLAAIIHGASFAFYSGAFEALYVHYFKKDLKDFYSKKIALINSVSIFAPIFAYAVAAQFSYRAVFFVAFIVFVILFLISIFLFKDVRTKENIDTTGGLKLLVQSGKDVKKTLFSNKFLQLQLVAAFLWGISKVPVDAYRSRVVADAWNENYNGIVFSMVSLAGILGSLTARKVKNGKFAYWFCFAITAAAVTLSGIFMGNFIVIPFFIMRSFAGDLHEVFYSVIFNKQIKKNRAVLLSLYSLVPILGSLPSTIVFGYIADKYGYGSSWIISGIVLFMITAVLWKQMKVLEE